jgi:hypothetical protein
MPSEPKLDMLRASKYCSSRVDSMTDQVKLSINYEQEKKTAWQNFDFTALG